MPYFSVVYKNEGTLTLMAALKEKAFPLNLESRLKLGSNGGDEELSVPVSSARVLAAGERL